MLGRNPRPYRQEIQTTKRQHRSLKRSFQFRPRTAMQNYFGCRAYSDRQYSPRRAIVPAALGDGALAFTRLQMGGAISPNRPRQSATCRVLLDTGIRLRTL